MAKKSSSNLLSALLYLILGILLVVFKSGALGMAMTIAGIIFIVSGIIEIIKKEMAGGIVSLVIGIVILLLGNLVVDVVLLVLGILIAVKGVISLIEECKKKKKSALGITFAILTVILGIMLAFGNALDVMILVCGVVFIIDGVLGLISVVSKK